MDSNTILSNILQEEVFYKRNFKKRTLVSISLLSQLIW